MCRQLEVPGKVLLEAVDGGSGLKRRVEVLCSLSDSEPASPEVEWPGIAGRGSRCLRRAPLRIVLGRDRCLLGRRNQCGGALVAVMREAVDLADLLLKEHPWRSAVLSELAPA